MIEEITHEERINNQRKGNLIVAMLLPLGYMEYKGYDYDDMSNYYVKVLAKGWKEVETPKQFIDAMALNWEAFGSEIISKEADDKEGTLIMTDFASEDDLAFLEMTRDQYDKLHEFIVNMAEHLGMSATITRDGVRTTVEVSA